MRSIDSIHTVGVVGAGTMGSGIASACAIAGFKTLIYDLNSKVVSDAISGFRKGFEKLVKKGKIDSAKSKTAGDSLYGLTAFDELSGCDFVIEAAVEDLNKKRVIFEELERIVHDEVILATNTSSLSITAISAPLKKNRSRLVGMHFFNPASIMKLVEIIRSEFTDDEVIAVVQSMCRKLGKVPVMCKDTPAFIVNRVARSYYGESLKILGEESIGVEQIDQIMKEEGGFSMGPFELMDLIGIDVNLSVTKSVYEAFYFDQKYKPSLIQQKMVDSGMLGRKTGQGFYKY